MAVNIILASHGELSKGVLNSAKMIVGDLDKNVETYSLYPGENPIDYANELRKRIESSDDSWIILADILGGSVHTALLQLTAYEQVTVFSGMNLNLVLAILLDRSGDLSEEHFASIVEESKLGITCKKHMDAQCEEEF